MVTFPAMHTIVPEGVSGNCRIRHFEISPRDSQMTSIRAMVNPGRQEYIATGKYAQLLVGGGVMMSDTQMEQDSNRRVVQAATGNVLIAGLGLGMILHPMAAKPEVTSITVLELSPDVIKLVGHTVPAKVQVIEADVFTWQPPRGVKYDTIYFDIWPDITTDNLVEMRKLHQRYGCRKTALGWMNSWMRQQLLRRKELEPKPSKFRFSWG